MLANFFGKSKPVNFILIVVLFLIYNYLNLFLHKSNTVELSTFLNNLIFLLGFIVIFFLFVFIVAKNKLTFDNTYAFLLFVISIGFLNISSISYWKIAEVILLLLLLRRVYSLRTLNATFQKLYDSGLWLGVLFLIASQNLVYILVVYGGILLFVKLTYKSVIIPLIGVVTPLFLFFTFHFYQDSMSEFYQVFDLNLGVNFQFLDVFSNQIVLMIFGILTLVSVLFKSGDIFAVSNKFKRSWVLLMVHFITVILYLLIKENVTSVDLLLFLIPSTIIIANWIQSIKRKVIVNLILTFLLAMSIAIHFIV